MVANPINAVGQHSNVSSAGFIGPRRDITRKLFQSLGLNLAFAEVSFDFDNGRTNFDINAAAISKLRLKKNVANIVFFKLERRSKKELSNVSLNVGFTSCGFAIRQSSEQIDKRGRQNGHWRVRDDGKRWNHFRASTDDLVAGQLRREACNRSTTKPGALNRSALSLADKPLVRILFRGRLVVPALCGSKMKKGDL